MSFSTVTVGRILWAKLTVTVVVLPVGVPVFPARSFTPAGVTVTTMEPVLNEDEGVMVTMFLSWRKASGLVKRVSVSLTVSERLRITRSRSAERCDGGVSCGDVICLEPGHGFTKCDVYGERVLRCGRLWHQIATAVVDLGSDDCHRRRSGIILHGDGFDARRVGDCLLFCVLNAVCMQWQGEVAIGCARSGG